MDAVSYSETLRITYETTRHHITEESKIHSRLLWEHDISQQSYLLPCLLLMKVFTAQSIPWRETGPIFISTLSVSTKLTPHWSTWTLGSGLTSPSMIECKQGPIFLYRSFEMHLFALWANCWIFIIFVYRRLGAIFWRMYEFFGILG
jgi:hypothetical protein